MGAKVMMSGEAGAGTRGGGGADGAWLRELSALSPWQVEKIEEAARRCAAAGYRRIALYGAGRHSERIVRQPWAEHDVRVVALIDDEARGMGGAVRGVPIVRPGALDAVMVDAVIVSSDAHEEALFARAMKEFGAGSVRAAGGGALPVVRIYGEKHPDLAARTRARLIEHWGVRADDADWLMANRGERHDATLPMLAPERTELHLRRYELAATLAEGKRCLDIACGTGYGSRVLLAHGASSYVGVDIDARTIEYAVRRFGAEAGGRARFLCTSATGTGLADSSVDLAVSFETIEHVPDVGAFVAELARVVSRGGTLVMSTPNDGGLTDYHVHSFTREMLERALSGTFAGLRWFGQRTAGVAVLSGRCAGIEEVGDGEEGSARPEHWIVVGTRN